VFFSAIVIVSRWEVKSIIKTRAQMQEQVAHDQVTTAAAPHRQEIRTSPVH